MEHDYSKYIRKFPSGATIFSEGQETYEMYFIHSGEVRIEKNVGDKKEFLALLQKGDFFGEMSLLDHVPRSATAIASTDVELLEVNGENFNPLLEGNIEIAIRMIRKYIARLRETNERLCVALKVKNELDQEIQEIVKTATKPLEKEPLEAMAVLSVAGKTYPIQGGETSIGRMDPATGLSPDVDLTEVDPNKTTSRKHARIRLSEGTWEVMEELGVKNGTFVNGQKIPQNAYIKLKDQDELQLGKVTLKLKVLGS